MPYEPPQTTQSGVAWSLTCRYGTVSAVQVDLSIVIGDSATEADGDAALQELVNLITGDSQFSQITAQKAYTSSETQAMQPS
ncbi:hypothetical protein [Streptomyces beihaiensis]|uniref:Uncharacterized protein n=1 Tax=Streptomyces beihaiensis TaxID=2984495 RepID=A0ABT3U4D4_9ACTN|nr:hypothetical protein [Streptomyces beihaiensis]MCX3064194.1 hypothetical protein [Streptomyces beihaiensis]